MGPAIQSILEVSQSPSVLEELGIAESFQPQKVYEDHAVEAYVSDAVPLKGGHKIQAVDVINVGDDNNTGDITGVFLYEERENGVTPTGYIVYTHSRENPRVVTVSINYFKVNKLREIASNFSQGIQETISRGDVLEGLMIIDPGSRRSGMGKLLWTVGAAVMQQRGIAEIAIYGDHTITAADNTFYSKMGAKVRDDGVEVYETSMVNESADYLKDILGMDDGLLIAKD